MTPRTLRQSGAFELVRAPRHVVRCDGELLRRYRTAWSVSLAQIAEGAGVSVQALRNAERGQPVTLETAQRLSAYTGMPLETLLQSSPTVETDALAEQGLKPPPPSRALVGRSELIEQLVEGLGGPDGGVFVLSGVSGIGKTEVARRVAAELDEALPGASVWVDCANLNTDDRVLATQKRIAMALGFAGRMPESAGVRGDAIAVAFQSLLWSGQRLLVLDDVSATRVLRLFDGEAMAGHRVLVTTRLRSVAAASGGEELRLAPLDESATCELLAQYVGERRLESDVAGRRELLDMLGGIPRAVHVAGRVLARERYTGLGEFAAQYGGYDEMLRDGAPGDWNRGEVSDVHHAGSVERFLTSEALGVFGSLQVFGRRPFGLEWAVAACDEPARTVRRCVAELVDLYVFDDVSDRGASRGPAGAAVFRRADADRIRVPITAAAWKDAEARVTAYLVERARAVPAEPSAAAAYSVAAEWDCWLAWVEWAATELPDVPETSGWPDAPVERHEAVEGTALAALPEIVAALCRVSETIDLDVPGAHVHAALRVEWSSASPEARGHLWSWAARHNLVRRSDAAAALHAAEQAAAALGSRVAGEAQQRATIRLARLRLRAGESASAIAGLEATVASAPDIAARLWLGNELAAARAHDAPSEPGSGPWSALEADLSELAAQSSFGAPTVPLELNAALAFNPAVWAWQADSLAGLADLRSAAAGLLATVADWPFARARLFATAALAGFTLDGLAPEFCGELGLRAVYDALGAARPRARQAARAEVVRLLEDAAAHAEHESGARAGRAFHALLGGEALTVAGDSSLGMRRAARSQLPAFFFPRAASAELVRRDRAGRLLEAAARSLAPGDPRAARLEATVALLQAAGPV